MLYPRRYVRDSPFEEESHHVTVFYTRAMPKPYSHENVNRDADVAESNSHAPLSVADSMEPPKT